MVAPLTDAELKRLREMHAGAVILAAPELMPDQARRNAAFFIEMVKVLPALLDEIEEYREKANEAPEADFND